MKRLEKFVIMLVIMVWGMGIVQYVPAEVLNDAKSSNIIIGKDCNGTLVSGERYRFGFTMEKPGKVTINFFSECNETSGDFFDDLAGQKRSTSWNSLNGKWSATSSVYLSKGTYIYSFYCTGNGTYKIESTFSEVKETFSEIQGGNNNTFNTANDIELGVEYYGLLSQDDLVDVYKFTVPEDSVIEINTEAFPILGWLTYRIYDFQGNVFASKSLGYYNKHYGESSNWKDKYEIKKGIYYLAFEGFERHLGGDYSFQIKNFQHIYDSKFTIDKEATCTSEGYKSKHCIEPGCTSVIEKTPIPALGHCFTNYASDGNATCFADGTKTAKCDRCDAIDTVKDIGSGGKHQWEEWQTISIATVFAPAKQSRICSMCGTQETKIVGSKVTPTIKLNYTKLILKVGQSTNAVKIKDLATGDFVKSWKSSDTKIVKVDNKGKITAQKSTGKAIVTVMLASKKTAKIVVTVQNSTVKTQKLTVLKAKITLKKGQKITLKPVRSPITSTEKIIYETSNKNIVTVNSKGVIKGIKKGSAIISIKSGSKIVKCIITVK